MIRDVKSVLLGGETLNHSKDNGRNLYIIKHCSLFVYAPSHMPLHISVKYGAEILIQTSM